MERNWELPHLAPLVRTLVDLTIAVGTAITTMQERLGATCGETLQVLSEVVNSDCVQVTDCASCGKAWTDLLQPFCVCCGGCRHVLATDKYFIDIGGKVPQC